MEVFYIPKTPLCAENVLSSPCCVSYCLLACVSAHRGCSSAGFMQKVIKEDSRESYANVYREMYVWSSHCDRNCSCQKLPWPLYEATHFCWSMIMYHDCTCSFCSASYLPFGLRVKGDALFFIAEKDPRNICFSVYICYALMVLVLPFIALMIDKGLFIQDKSSGSRQLLSTRCLLLWVSDFPVFHQFWIHLLMRSEFLSLPLFPTTYI